MEKFLTISRGEWSLQQTINEISLNSIRHVKHNISIEPQRGSGGIGYKIEYLRGHRLFSFETVSETRKKMGVIRETINISSSSAPIGIFEFIDDLTVITYIRYQNWDIEEKFQIVNTGLCISSSKVKKYGELIATSFTSGIKSLALKPE
uniref:hypothetical protein n=1 Tax=Timspurckia oligopyrenoides TaxID=708627 RepID=UPI001FCD25EB|nr:hypothetical protein MW591_pgp053 [Timspurckia oligopyrenoides]UNJ17562.1 hypothetical protein [Timspurckia oligopyrenoides]